MKSEQTKTRTKSKTNKIRTNFVLSQTHNNHIYFHKRRCFPISIINNIFYSTGFFSVCEAESSDLCSNDITQESLPNHVAIAVAVGHSSSNHEMFRMKYFTRSLAITVFGMPDDHCCLIHAYRSECLTIRVTTGVTQVPITVQPAKRK